MRRFNPNQAKMMLDSFAIIHNRVIHFRFICFINSSATTDILISSDDDTAQYCLPLNKTHDHCVSCPTTAFLFDAQSRISTSVRFVFSLLFLSWWRISAILSDLRCKLWGLYTRLFNAVIAVCHSSGVRALDLYTRVRRFESRPGHKFFWV